MLASCQFCVISRAPSTGDLSQLMPSALLCCNGNEGPAARAFFLALVSLLPWGGGLPCLGEMSLSTCSSGRAIASGTAGIAVPIAKLASVSQRRSPHQVHINPRGGGDPPGALIQPPACSRTVINTGSGQMWLCLAKSGKPSRGFPATPGFPTFLQPLSESWR